MAENNSGVFGSTVAIIPSYEPPRSLIDYVESLLKEGVSHCVIVNDGSGEKYAEIYGTLEKNSKCSVVGYEKNCGKGHALKKAFEYCRDNFDEGTVFVTADCDGQHLAKDVLRVARRAMEYPSALWLGARDFSNPGVPKRSRSGNISTRRIFSFLYGLSIQDTQTGLRAFAYPLLERLISISGSRFEYEMNMLIVLHKADVEIKEEPIETVYLGKSDDVERVSHFRTFKDSFKVVATLLKNLEWYMLSVMLSAVVDVVAFYLLLRFAFPYEAPWLQALLATVLARVTSSIINFFFNNKLVFGGHSKSSILKYYTLWLCLLSTTYGITCIWNFLFSNKLLVALLKGTTDLLLGILSYQVQNRWVFAKKKQKVKEKA